MDITTEKYKERIKVDLQTFQEKIEPLSDYLGGEYGPAIVDYTKIKAITNRNIIPYKQSENHGKKSYYGLAELFQITRPKHILDLGCGMGELLNETRKYIEAKLYGCTIHVGEVIAAKQEYGIELLAADMRKIDEYFQPNSLDLIIANASFHFLNEDDQHITVKAIHNILHKDGYFLLVHYKDPAHFTITQLKNFIEIKRISKLIGPAFLYKKE